MNPDCVFVVTNNGLAPVPRTGWAVSLYSDVACLPHWNKDGFSSLGKLMVINREKKQILSLVPNSIRRVKEIW